MAFAQAGTPTTVKTNNANTTPALDSTGADLIVLSIVAPDGALYVSGADSRTNTWNNPTTLVRNSPAAVRVGMPYVLNPSVGSGHTFSTQQQYWQSGIIAACFSGVGSFDQESSQSSIASGTSHTVASGAMTPSGAGALIISLLAPPHGTDPGTVTPPSGMAMLDFIPHGSNTYKIYVAFEIQTSIQARTPTWTTQNACTSCGITQIYLPAGGGGGGGGGGSAPIQLILPQQGIFLSNARRRN